MNQRQVSMYTSFQQGRFQIEKKVTEEQGSSRRNVCIYILSASGANKTNRKKMSKNKLALIITFKSPHSLLQLRKHSTEGSTMFAVTNSTNYSRRDLNHILKSPKSHDRVS